MGCEFFIAREFFGVTMLHRRVCVMVGCFGLSRTSLLSLGNWISHSGWFLWTARDEKRWFRHGQTWHRERLWSAMIGPRSEATRVHHEVWKMDWRAGWGLERDLLLSLPGLKAVIPVYAHRFQCPSLFSHELNLISKESRPPGMREGTWAPWIPPCLKLEFQLAFSWEFPWAHKISHPAFAVKCCRLGSRVSCCSVASVMSNSLRPCGLQPARLLCPRGFLGKNTGVGCCALLQGIFPTQRLNPGLLHCRQGLYHWATREAPGSCLC